MVAQQATTKNDDNRGENALESKEDARELLDLLRKVMPNRQKFQALKLRGLTAGQIRDAMNLPTTYRTGGKVSYSQVYIGLATSGPKEDRKYTSKQGAGKAGKGKAGFVCNCDEPVCVCAERNPKAAKPVCECYKVRKGEQESCPIHG